MASVSPGILRMRAGLGQIHKANILTKYKIIVEFFDNMVKEERAICR